MGKGSACGEYPFPGRGESHKEDGLSWRISLFLGGTDTERRVALERCRFFAKEEGRGRAGLVVSIASVRDVPGAGGRFPAFRFLPKSGRQAMRHAWGGNGGVELMFRSGRGVMLLKHDSVSAEMAENGLLRPAPAP